MNKKLFERLCESMKQHGKIARGERAHSRAFFLSCRSSEKYSDGQNRTGTSPPDRQEPSYEQSRLNRKPFLRRWPSEKRATCRP